MAQTPNGTPDPKRISHFCDIVEHCVHECADTRCGPHDVFLWNARRLSEAILYALAEGTELARPNKSSAYDLKELANNLVKAGRLHDKVYHSFEALRSCGNVGAHTQGPEGIPDGPTIRQSLASIVTVVEWFFLDSLLRREMPARVQQDLADIKSDKPKPSRSDRHESQLRLLDARCRAAEDAAVEAQRRLSKLTSALSTQPNVTPTVTEVVAMAQSGRSLGRKLLLVAVGMGLGAAIAWAALHFGQETPAMPAATVALAPPACPPAKACPAAEPCPAPVPCPACEVAVPAAATVATAGAEPTAPAEAGPAEAAEDVETAAPAAAAESAPKVLSCGDGALLVEAGKLRFRKGPSPRPEWSQPRPKPPPTAVPAFCIHREPLKAQTFADAMADGPCKPTQGNAVRRGAGDLPVNFVSRSCAQQYCEGLGGSLPTIAQWERAMRAHKPPQLQSETWELAADPFPFAVFGDAPSAKGKPTHAYFNRILGPRPRGDRPYLSWNKDSTVAAGHIATSFRCAWPVKPAEGAP